MKIGVLQHKTISLFEFAGLTGPFWQINLETVLCTWGCMAVLFVGTWLLYRTRNSQDSLAWFLLEVPAGFFHSTLAETPLADPISPTKFILSLVLFVMACNLSGVFLFVHEPTSDANTTFAISIISFIYIQSICIAHKGASYFWKFLKPLPFFLPMNILAQGAKIMSLALRLFGNVLSGAIIWDVLFEGVLVRLKYLFIFSVLAMLFFEFLRAKKNIFSFDKIIKWLRIISFAPVGVLVYFCVAHEGLIQSFVIGLLSTIYISTELGGGHD